MSAFLQLVANDLYKRYGEGISGLTLVFPNRRPILFFNKYMSEVVSKPVWAPECKTISNFIADFSKLKKADDISLLFDLYPIYTSITSSSETFDNFYYWGELLLSDFDDIDKYMINAADLFKNLAAYKNINEQFSYLSDEQVSAIKQFWNHFTISRESEHHKEFSGLWMLLSDIYIRYRQHLTSHNVAYEGMLYREVAENIKKRISNELVKTTVFIGFNALNECEKEIFRTFKQINKAIFYWDYEQEYIEKPIHEAGFFIRQNVKEFPPALSFSPSSAKPEIHLISFPSGIAQAKASGVMLKEPGNKTEEPEKTALLLTDENYLLPLLKSIPDEIDDINITMGYPLRNTQTLAFIKDYFGLHQKSNPEKGFYYKNLLKIFKHSFLSNYKNIFERIEKTAISKNKIYFKSTDFADDNLLNDIASTPLTGTEVGNNLNLILTRFLNDILNKDNSQSYILIEKEALSKVITSINLISPRFNESAFNISATVSMRMILKAITNLTIPFDGEPLKGIQIMGFLESRALDFEKVYILGTNEGNLPKTNLPLSYIPYNIRKGFGLPTIEYRDAMYAYYFYRVINRASQVYLLYSSGNNQDNNTEPSRFALQLQFNSAYKVVRKSQSFSVNSSKPSPIRIEKNEAILKKLYEYTKPESKKYFSPSALISYIECSLKYYFRYIAGIKEQDVPMEEIDPSLLGRILHKALYDIYIPYINSELKKADFELKFLNQKFIEENVLSAIQSEYLGNEKVDNASSLSGRNFIIYKILIRYVEQIIKIDSSLVPFTPLHLEYHISKPLFIENLNASINLGGNIDRVDKVKNSIRIIDYKTGAVDRKCYSIDELFSIPDKGKHRKEVFQALFYSNIYKDLNTSEAEITPSIYPLREIFNEIFDYQLYLNKSVINDISNVKDEYNQNLILLIESIFNKDLAFVQTEKKDTCKNCAYNSICRKV